MPPSARSGRGPKAQPPKNGRTELRQQKRKREQEDLSQLEQRVAELVRRMVMCTCQLNPD
jgi:ATP-dependent RNA helicase DDX10/DBP4